MTLALPLVEYVLPNAILEHLPVERHLTISSAYFFFLPRFVCARCPFEQPCPKSWQPLVPYLRPPLNLPVQSIDAHS